MPIPAQQQQEPLSDTISPLIANDRCIFELSSRTGINRSTIRKVLAKQRITPLVELKLRKALADLEDRDMYSLSNESAIKKLIDVHNLYLQLQTLDAVGKRIGLTRERVRQLLQIGTSLGLFKYTPSEKRRLSKHVARDELLAAYASHPSLRVVATTHHISLPTLRSLLTSHSVTREQLETMRQEKRRRMCIEQYDDMIKELGHHPSTTEMHGKPEWQALVTRIIRLWGTINAFREDLRIPVPNRAFGHKIQHAILTKEKDLNSIRACLKSSSPLSKREVAAICNLSIDRAQRLLSLLARTGETKRIGLMKSNKTKYLLT